jgi:AcrR family transcriptional regulator
MQSARKTQAERSSTARRSLMEAVVDVIAEDGVSAVTFETVGKASGYSRGLASRHFGSKQSLVESTLKHIAATQRQTVRETFDNGRGLASILAFVDQSLSRVATHPEAKAHAMLLCASIADANDLRSVFAETHEDVRRQLAAKILEGQGDGEIRRDLDADAIALTIAGTILGLLVHSLVDPHLDVSVARQEHAAALRRSLAPQI